MDDGGERLDVFGWEFVTTFSRFSLFYLNCRFSIPQKNRNNNAWLRRRLLEGAFGVKEGAQLAKRKKKLVEQYCFVRGGEAKKKKKTRRAPSFFSLGSSPRLAWSLFAPNFLLSLQKRRSHCALRPLHRVRREKERAKVAPTGGEMKRTACIGSQRRGLFFFPVASRSETFRAFKGRKRVPLPHLPPVFRARACHEVFSGLFSYLIFLFFQKRLADSTSTSHFFFLSNFKKLTNER